VSALFSGAGTTVNLQNPYGVAVSSSGIVFVADGGNHLIRRVHASGKTRSPVLVKVRGS
jgi:16S rRNA C1402 (ribose-2'-O) methylase RsmI